jgi:hypothetical protein
VPIIRVFPVLAIGAAVLGSTALPAAAAPVSKPKVHTFKLPAVTGITVTGTYSFAGGKAHITMCAKENASDVDLVVATATAVNANVTKHQTLGIEIIGSNKHVCKSLVTSDAAHLYAEATSGTTNGKSHIGKITRIY